MRRNAYCTLLAGISLLLGAATVAAHHSFDAEFDSKSPIEFKGTVQQVEWFNPHAFVRVEVKNDDGTVSTYRAIIGAPISLYRQGWRPNSVPPGTPVSFTGSRAKNPESRNVNGTLTGPDGKELFEGEGPQGAIE
jgi:hypothetical protein